MRDTALKDLIALTGTPLLHLSEPCRLGKHRTCAWTYCRCSCGHGDDYATPARTRDRAGTAATSSSSRGQRPRRDAGDSRDIPAPTGERNSRSIPQSVQIAVAARDRGRCRGWPAGIECGSTTDLQFDHVIPWSKGGANTTGNIQLLCGQCNARKGAKAPVPLW